MPCDYIHAVGVITYQASNAFGLDKKMTEQLFGHFFGANGRIRTGDLFITSELLYQLSHISIK